MTDEPSGNDYILPLLVLSDQKKYTIQIAIKNFIGPRVSERKKKSALSESFSGFRSGADFRRRAAPWDFKVYRISPGKAEIEYRNLSEKSKTLVDSFFVGIRLIADEFPDYVAIM